MKKSLFERIRQLFRPVPEPQPKPEPVPQPAPAPKPEREESPEPDYKDPEYKSLVQQCAMGDMVSMLELGRWHRRYIRPSSEALFAAYEAGDSAVYGQLYQRLFRNYEDGLSCNAYITWVYRAALYGNPEAEALVEKCGLYAQTGILKPKTQNLGSFGSELYYSYELERLGLAGIRAGMDEFGLYPLGEDGIHRAYYLADYIPADSDGFGREEEYADVYYDEFFNCLSGDYQKAKALLPAMKAKRDAYWAIPAHDAEHRKYRRLLAE